jgi:hypothetical protein
MKISTQNAKRIITRFENAVRDHAFIGTIPADESESAAEAYDACQRRYELARKAIERFCIEAVISGTG